MAGARFTLHRLAGLLVAGWLAGCAAMPTPSYQPSVDTTQLLLQRRDASMAAGAFSAASDVPNRTLAVRANQLSADGIDGTFSGYLRNALIIELKTAGRFDEDSPIRIDGTLLRNELNAGAGTGSATLETHFTVTRRGARIYDKSLTVVHKWDSSFMGAIAIPAAVQNYVGAVQKLLQKFLTDPDFVRALGQRSAQSAQSALSSTRIRTGDPGKLVR